MKKCPLRTAVGDGGEVGKHRVGGGADKKLAEAEAEVKRATERSSTRINDAHAQVRKAQQMADKIFQDLSKKRVVCVCVYVCVCACVCARARARVCIRYGLFYMVYSSSIVLAFLTVSLSIRYQQCTLHRIDKLHTTSCLALL